MVSRLRDPYGVSVAAEWLGTLIYGLDHPVIQWSTADLAEEDNGYTRLKRDMFKEIPDSALRYLNIARGTLQKTGGREDNIHDSGGNARNIAVHYILGNDAERENAAGKKGSEEDRT